ncbi:multicopper oxidase family protein [Methyloprofundus sp.]|uniref:multicopper oxidase family protein n=1 Tax=Methyloprofundus sp. TaxID=2020875 RepID=UPI003D0A1461
MKITHLVLSSLLGFCLSSSLGVAGQSDFSISDLKKELKNEFTNSYPEQQKPTGKIKSFELVAAENNIGIIPPYKTLVWAYNGMVPGPVIRIKLGDTLQLKLINNLPQATTIHWHGIRVPNAMDGVPGVTQAPVQSGDSFTYKFTPKDAGTFWFHPHVNAAEQIERGLHGVLIVEDPDEPEYSQEFVWVLDDWLLTKDWQVSANFVTRHDLAHDGRWGNVLTINGRYQPIFQVKAGERIRIRMINVANGRVFSPAFARLMPYVIAVDGMLTEAPFPLQEFYVAPGNRVDLDIIIPKSLAGKKLLVQNLYGRQKSALAFLQVAAEEAVETPVFDSPRAIQFPRWADATKLPIEHEYVLNAKRGGVYGISWTIDDKIWPENAAYELTSGQFYSLRFTNKSSRLHPMHLHGQFFKVIAKNGKAVEERYWRDTVLIGPKQSIDIGIIPLDKGLWANHCHILEHAEAGMMTTIKVK